MRAKDVMNHFREIGAWVNWEDTCDRFLFGSPDAEVRGIAVAWSPTDETLKKAAARGLNFFITHEPAFYQGYEKKPGVQQLIEQKKNLLSEHSMVMLRCHDTWDRMPEWGIVDAWGEFLGFPTESRPVSSFYKICLTGGLEVAELGKRIRDRVKPLGQQAVLLLGDPKRKTGRMAVGTGAITNLPDMFELEPDVILATDDGVNFWTGALWSVDMGLPLLIVNHAASEKPGMMKMAEYLSGRFADVKVEYIEVPFPYRVL